MMSVPSGKRASSEDINLQRKRRRTLSNDLLRGLVMMPNMDSSQSTSSSELSYESPVSETEDDSDYGPSYTEESKEGGCSKCRTDSTEMLEKQNEILTLLRELKRDSESMHKMLEMQIRICRQEITEQICDMKQTVKQMLGAWRTKSLADGNGDRIPEAAMDDEHWIVADDVDVEEEIFR